MTWKYAVNLLLIAITNGESKQTRDTAKRDLLNIATVVDAIATGEIEVSNDDMLKIKAILNGSN